MDNRNMIMAVVLSIIIMFGFQFYWDSQPPPPGTVQKSAGAKKGQDSKTPSGAPSSELPAVPDPDGGEDLQVPIPGVTTPSLDQAQLKSALKSGPRVRIDSPRLSGTISLRGARFDDLTLLDY
ncbi:MAG: hypothetical protein QGF09_14890, partial [Rhodospirillales bacterium]|nr:hypothetical protein [Rhodospirillales bacterium]